MGLSLKNDRIVHEEIRDKIKGLDLMVEMWFEKKEKRNGKKRMSDDGFARALIKRIKIRWIPIKNIKNNFSL